MALEKKRSAAASQREKFLDAARDLDCDESEQQFDAALKKVASAPPPKDEKGKKPDTKKPGH